MALSPLFLPSGPRAWTWTIAAPASQQRAAASPISSGCLGITAPSRSCCMPPLRATRSEEHTSELHSLAYLVCRLLLEKKKHLERRFRVAVWIEQVVLRDRRANRAEIVGDLARFFF